MDDQIADLIALGKGIEESLPDNAEELLTLVHRLLCAHRSQHAAIEKLEKEFLAPFYDGYGEGGAKQRHSRVADIAAETVSPNFTLHLFTRLEDAGLAMVRPLVALAQTRKPQEMVLPPYVNEKALVNGKVITRQRKNNLKAPPSQLIENADHLHNAHRRAGGRGRHGSDEQREALASRHAEAQATWEQLEQSGWPKRDIASLVAKRMGVAPNTIRRWRRSNWGENQTNTS